MSNLVLIQGFLDGLKPDKKMTVSEWADENRYLSQEASSEYGKWRTSRTPYLKDIMDCLSSGTSYQKIIVQKGAQLGFTEMGNNWIGYIIDNSPAPTLMIQPTDDMVKRNSKMRIDPMITTSPALAEKVSQNKSRSKDNTISQKNFPGGILLMAGANSPAGLRSVPIKNLFLDEVDAYPIDLGGEGSPIALAEARTRTFAKRKELILSTPTIKGVSVIEKEFLDTDQNYFNVPCPHCGVFHILKMENLKWEKGKPDTAKMECPNCGELIEERFKPKMMESGIWESQCPDKKSKIVIGFHLSSFYSPYGWYSWKEIAADFEKAEKDTMKMKTFNNTVLGKTNEETGEAPQWKNLYNRRELYAPNTINKDVCFLTSGVDVQKDRIELEIVGWCIDRQSYSIDFRVLLGNTTLPDVWNQLAEVLEEKWKRPDGIDLKIVKMAIDSGYNTSEVYAFCRKHQQQTIPIKGSDKVQIAVSSPKQIDYNRRGSKIGKTKQWNLGVSLLKHELYSWLLIEKEEEKVPPCYCHFPQYNEKHFEGLTAEDYIPATRVWKKRYERNEPLDCRIYARAASIIVGLDRMKPEKLMEYGCMRNIEESVKKEKKSTEKKKKSSIWD